MSNKIPVDFLENEDVDAWNQWRAENQDQVVDLTGIELCDLELVGIDFSSVDLSDADLESANLSDADLEGANLRRADLTDANLSDADLEGANLSDADLTGANLSGTNLKNTNLTDAEYDNESLQNAREVAPIFINPDSLTEEEKIELHQKIAVFLVENELKLNGEPFKSYFILRLRDLWAETRKKLDDDQFQELFGDDIHVYDVIPYTYLAADRSSSGGYEFLDPLVDWGNYRSWRHYPWKSHSLGTEADVNEWVESGVFDFLYSVFNCLIIEIGDQKFDLELDLCDLSIHVAFVAKGIIETAKIAHQNNFQILLRELKYLLDALLSLITDPDFGDEPFDLYHYVEPSVLTGLLNCCRDITDEKYYLSTILGEWKEDGRLSGKNLTGVNFSNADLSDVDLSDSNLSKADLSGANLTGADLSDADLSGADLSGADLTDADLSDANLEGIITDENTQIELPE